MARTDGWLTAVCVLAVGGCAGSSTRSDLARVNDLARAPELPEVAGPEVDPETSEDVRALLARPLDADTAVRIALLGNRELRAQLRELGIARGELIQAGLVANPRVGVEANPERDTTIEVRVDYNLTSLVLAGRRAHAARAELEAARVHAAGAVVGVGYATRAAAYALEAAEQGLVFAQRMLDAFAAGRDAARALFDAGNLPEAETAAHVAAYERARITVAEVELEVAERREALQRLLGLHGDETTWNLDEELPPVPDSVSVPDDLEARAISASLELREARHRLEALARRTGVSRTEGWLPDIDADVHVLRGNPGNSTDPSADDLRFGAGVDVRVPLFDRQQGTTRAREAEFDALLERYHGMAIDIRSVAREMRNRVRSLHARARQLEHVVLPAQTNVLAQTHLQYNAMQVGVFELLRARRELLDVELEYVNTLRDYWIASSALDVLLAGWRVDSSMDRHEGAWRTGSDSDGGH